MSVVSDGSWLRSFRGNRRRGASEVPALQATMRNCALTCRRSRPPQATWQKRAAARASAVLTLWIGWPSNSTTHERPSASSFRFHHRRQWAKRRGARRTVGCRLLVSAAPSARRWKTPFAVSTKDRLGPASQEALRIAPRTRSCVNAQEQKPRQMTERALPGFVSILNLSRSPASPQQPGRFVAGEPPVAAPHLLLGARNQYDAAMESLFGMVAYCGAEVLQIAPRSPPSSHSAAALVAWPLAITPRDIGAARTAR